MIKFILHSNLPGHYDFGHYARCPFEITCAALSAATPLGANGTTDGTPAEEDDDEDEEDDDDSDALPDNGNQQGAELGQGAENGADAEDHNEVGDGRGSRNGDLHNHLVIRNESKVSDGQQEGLMKLLYRLRAVQHQPGVKKLPPLPSGLA